MTGYAYADELVADHTDILALGNLKHLLELNCRVLCGTDATVRQDSAEHLRAAEERFYNAPGAGIRDIVEWHEKHHAEFGMAIGRPACISASSASRSCLSRVIIALARLSSAISLARDGLPPFVLTPGNAQEFLDPSSLIKKIDKREFIANSAHPAAKEAVWQDSSSRRLTRRMSGDEVGGGAFDRIEGGPGEHMMPGTDASEQRIEPRAAEPGRSGSRRR